jgi:hypothetical protein
MLQDFLLEVASSWGVLQNKMEIKFDAVHPILVHLSLNMRPLLE